jgi:hypothetical protein
MPKGRSAIDANSCFARWYSLHLNSPPDSISRVALSPPILPILEHASLLHHAELLKRPAGLRSSYSSLALATGGNYPVTGYSPLLRQSEVSNMVSVCSTFQQRAPRA